VPGNLPENFVWISYRRSKLREPYVLESYRALTAQNSNQRECYDCSRKKCQNHPSPQLRIRLRQAQHVYRGIGATKNLRARRSIRGRKRFRCRSRLRRTRPGPFRNFAAHCPDTSTNCRRQKQDFQRVSDFAWFQDGIALQASKARRPTRAGYRTANWTNASAATAPAKIASTSQREIPRFRFRSCRTCPESPGTAGARCAYCSIVPANSGLPADSAVNSGTRLNFWCLMALILPPRIQAPRRGRAGGAYPLLAFREDSLAVLPRTNAPESFPFRERRTAAEHFYVRDISFADHPVVQPFNSASIFGSSANFASAVALVKYSNPQEGPR